MNNLRTLVVALLFGVLLSSCTTYRQFGYFQDIKKVELGAFPVEYESHIRPDDRLRIMVFGPDSKVVAPYNLVMGDGNLSNTNSHTGYTYLVDKDGVISFPTLGDIDVAGMTRRELEKYLTMQISMDVKDPTVIVNYENHGFTILGDVSKPGTYKMESERIGIMKAIGMAGDLSISARRDDVLLIREIDGVPQYCVLNLKKAGVLSDPHYFLQNNDILYVRPGSARVTERTVGFWASLFSAITSFATTALLWSTYSK